MGINDMKKQIKTLVVKSKEIIKNLPEQARKVLHKLVAIVRTYIKDIDVYIKIFKKYMTKVDEFAKPMKNYLVVVKTTLKKHFGPVYDEVRDVIRAELKKIKLPSVRMLMNAEL